VDGPAWLLFLIPCAVLVGDSIRGRVVINEQHSSIRVFTAFRTFDVDVADIDFVLAPRRGGVKLFKHQGSSGRRIVQLPLGTDGKGVRRLCAEIGVPLRRKVR
jgi:hypothetical protein